MGEMSLGTLYELNRTAMENEKPLKPFEVKDKLRKIQKFLLSCEDKFFMLLCRERCDFTLFAMYNKNDMSLNTTAADINECLTNRGEIISIDPTENNDAFEIWLKIDNEYYIYYLFPYDLGVIEEGI